MGTGAGWGARRDLSTHLKVRFAAVDPGVAGIERAVMFLQDVTAIENQAQQLKLASMGRLTASIAHEVRNPLSAIGHATALLDEDLDDPGHRRLLRIVADNVARVNRMVEDILQLSRKVQTQNEPLALDVFLAELRAEFVDTQGLSADIITLAVAPKALVRFDPLHLREVVLNLKTRVHLRDDGMRPLIELEPTDHPLAVEQRAGISLGRMAQLHSRHSTCHWAWGN